MSFLQPGSTPQAQFECTCFAISCLRRNFQDPGAQEPSSIEKIAEVDTHVGVAMSGLTADARTLIEHARVETQV